jgi:hypothetical protein
MVSLIFTGEQFRVSGLAFRNWVAAEALRAQRGEAATELTVHEAANQRIVEWMSGVRIERDELTGRGRWSRRVSWKRKALL